ncbi:MAG: ATP-binding cassette domain-containing protein [Flavobacteriales bacterium]|nr:ATP-binding cassette domain-containing protein [Flavobacteriales bacterium]
MAEYIKLADGSEVSASALLTQFLFPPKMQYNFVGKLSGGEKRRLQLMRVLMANPNFLILDEPTNDFDIMTLNVLENYLEKFSGCIMIVSHDRYFMDRLVDHLFVFEGKGKVRDFPGNYSDFRQSGLTLKEKPTSTKSVEQKPEKSETVKADKQKLTFKEKYELDEISKELPKLEKKKANLLDEMNSEQDYEKLESLGAELKQVEEKLESKEMRWLELSEKEN